VNDKEPEKEAEPKVEAVDDTEQARDMVRKALADCRGARREAERKAWRVRSRRWRR
jgi:hypothetical protein